MNGLDPVGDLLAILGDAFGSPEAVGSGLVLLAAVFLWTGVVKLRSPALAALAMVDLGVVHHARVRAGRAAGAAELTLAIGLAIGLVDGGIETMALIVASVALWFFVGLVLRALRRDEPVACFCFGDADAVVSRRALARTAGLALLATVLGVISVRNSAVSARLEPEVVVGVGALGIVVAAATVPRLLRWNADPYGYGELYWLKRRGVKS